MTPEIFTMIGAAGTAIVAFYLSIKKEEGWRRRFAVVATLGFAAVGGIGALEEFARKRSLENLGEEIDRKWIVLKEAYVEGVEFEILSPDGYVDLADLLRFSRAVRLQVSGVTVPIDTKHARQGIFEFAEIFTLDNLARGGRLGIPLARVRLSRDQKVIEQMKEVACVASSHITRDLLSKLARQSGSGSVCAVSVRLPLKAKAIKLGALSAATKISLTITKPPEVTCIGVCATGPVMSVRLVLGASGDIFPPMIEVSPTTHLRAASSTSATAEAATFELSGSAALELAKSRYRESFGYMNRERFIVTLGMLDRLYRSLTIRTEKLTVIDVVWTTTVSPTIESLEGAVDPDNRGRIEPMRAPEWCGFGERHLCWHRFVMARPLSK